MSDQGNSKRQLARKLGITGLAATGICSMLGASINVVPFMIQRNVPDIGPYVLPAFLLAACPALFAAMAYAILASAMPRAGGSYIYASRGLNPYLGFVASFSQWFGLSIVIGVIAYLIIPFIRDIIIQLGWDEFSKVLELGVVRVGLALLLIWSFVLVNIRGASFYEKIVIPMMYTMFALGAIVIIAGFYYDHSDFIQALEITDNRTHELVGAPPFQLSTLFAGAAILFSSFIGFDSIAQAGGEAKNPSYTLPLSIGLAIGVVGSFYFLFTAAVYHAVPWSFISAEAQVMDISAPGILSYLLPAGFGIAILTGAAIALINDLPAMLLSVSRLMFAWAEDGIFPKNIARIHGNFRTPVVALAVSGIFASIGVLGSHFAGDFFLGIDIMVISMMVNFLLMCVTLIAIQKVNPTLAQSIQFCTNRKIQLGIGWTGVVLLSIFMTTHIWKDLNAEKEAWYLHSIPIWIIVMTGASILFFIKMNQLKKSGTDTKQLFKELPPG